MKNLMGVACAKQPLELVAKVLYLEQKMYLRAPPAKVEQASRPKL